MSRKPSKPTPAKPWKRKPWQGGPTPQDERIASKCKNVQTLPLFPEDQPSKPAAAEDETEINVADSMNRHPEHY